MFEGRGVYGVCVRVSECVRGVCVVCVRVSGLFSGMKPLQASCTEQTGGAFSPFKTKKLHGLLHSFDCVLLEKGTIQITFIASER